MNPERFGDIYARWMATADGCDCGNTQTPDARLAIWDGNPVYNVARPAVMA